MLTHLLNFGGIEMIIKTILKPVFAMALLCAPAWAQSESDSLSLGVPLNLPKIGEPYLAEKFGDWSLQCIRTKDAKDPCEMHQLMLNAEGQPMSEVSLFRLPQGQGAIAGANIIVPLETLLTTPIIIGFDEETRKQYPYTFCNSVGCVARIGLTENEVTLFKKGAVAKITVVHISRPNQPITFDMSLKGFTAAFNKTTVIGQ